MTYSQYGIYLIPPPPLLYQIGVAHQLLATNFNARLGGRFMVHCTVKGFFKLAEGVTPADFIPALDALLAATSAFPTRFTGLWNINKPTKGASILLGMERTEAFHKLHGEVWNIVRPYIATDCLFSPIEPAGPKFSPHVTLAMYDLPTEPGLFAQAVDLAQYFFDQYLRDEFLASNIQLIEFYAEDWAGEWGKNFTYKQLKGWHLPAQFEG
ncbi:MAG: 2'-5' RNA ligase family protein [Chloroflexota bacterium]|nr:2'-5' RNA ligase family protein [Chloroflexota bacterium]